MMLEDLLSDVQRLNYQLANIDEKHDKDIEEIREVMRDVQMQKTINKLTEQKISMTKSTEAKQTALV